MTAFIINVAFDCADPKTLSSFWAAVTGYDVDVQSTDVVRLRAPDGRGVRRLVFWKVPEPKVAKSRVHVDLATKEPGAEIGRLVSLGASVLRQEAAWTVLADPEGNEFCVG